MYTKSEPFVSIRFIYRLGLGVHLWSIYVCNFEVCTKHEAQGRLVYGEAMALAVLLHAHAILQLLLARGHHLQLLVITCPFG